MTSWLLPFINIDISGTGIWPSGSTNGKLWVSFEDNTDPAKYKDYAQYNVLATDYTSYAVVYGCSDKKNWLGKDVHSHTMWVLTRKGDVPEDKIKEYLKTGRDKTNDHFDSS